MTAHILFATEPDAGIGVNPHHHLVVSITGDTLEPMVGKRYIPYEGWELAFPASSPPGSANYAGTDT